MADIDSVIASGGTPVQITSPVDNMVKAMTMQDLYLNNQSKQMQNKVAQQQFSDNEAVRSAIQHNTSVDPDTGNIKQDSNGILQELGKTAPTQVMPYAQQVAQQQAAVKQMKVKAETERLGFLGQLLGGVQNQQDYDQAIKTYGAAGYDTSQVPTTFDPQQVKLQQGRALNAKDQIEAEQKARDMGIREQEAKIKAAQFGQEITKTKAQQLQETLSALQSARGNPAVQQAEKDSYSANKVQSLASQAVDPKTGKVDLNKLSPQQVTLLAQETLKMASGGQGTEDELKLLTPGSAKYKMAMMAQNLKNAPQDANAGAYAQQLLNYATAIGNDSRNLLKQNYQGVIESKKPYLQSSDYNNLNKQFLDRVSGKVDPSSDWGTIPTSQSNKDKALNGQAGATDTVKVQLPDGRTGVIPKANLQKAVSLGAKVLS
jgi:hypothetical protein